MKLPRFAPLSLVLCTALLCSACVIAPNTNSAADIGKMGEQAVQTCGAGNVREVSAKSFSCK